MTLIRIPTTPDRVRLQRLVVLALLALAAALAGVLAMPAAAHAGPCSTSTGASSCQVATQTTVAGGTLTLTHPANLYWNFVGNGYDQWASGSATALTGCTASAAGTSCSGGTAPRLEVDDATGSGSGWSLSGYVSSSNLPAGSTLAVNGAGSGTIGTATANPTNPFVATTPGTVCDFGSSCTTATPATTCTSAGHNGYGYTSCPAYGVNLLGGTSASNQVDLYSAAASSGLGAVCFGSGSPSSAGCTGSAATLFYNLGVKSNAPAGTYSGAVVTLTVSSGP